MTLAEAVAAAGGLLDIQADPGSVFLYRREPRELAEMLGVDCSKMDGPTVPIVYSVSFSDPAGYFLATRMQMHNKDVIFAANAQAVEITKFAAFLNTLIASRLMSGQLASHARICGSSARPVPHRRRRWCRRRWWYRHRHAKLRAARSTIAGVSSMPPIDSASFLWKFQQPSEMLARGGA